jgi:hypothetical protein
MHVPGRIYVGRVFRVMANFSRDEVDVDPDTVKLRVLSPSGVESEYTYVVDSASSAVVKTSAGDYYCDVTPDESGRWFYRWETTGTNLTDASEGSFLVQYSQFEEGIRRGYSS